jgi:hypothetical protein
MYLRRRSPLGVVLSLVIMGIGIGIVIPKIRAAFTASDRVDAQARRISQLAEGKLGSSYFIATNFRRELNAVRARLGPRAPMLQIAVARAGLEFQYVVGNRAAGLTVNTVQARLKPEEVTLDEPGSPRARAFSLALARAAVPAQLVRAVRHRPGLSDFAADSLMLARSDVDHRVEWTVTGAGGGHELVFTARPDGARLTRVD